MRRHVLHLNGVPVILRLASYLGVAARKAVGRTTQAA